MRVPHLVIFRVQVFVSYLNDSNSRRPTLRSLCPPLLTLW